MKLLQKIRKKENFNVELILHLDSQLWSNKTMAEQLPCSFCSHVGSTKVENNIKTVTYPKIKKKVKGKRFEEFKFDPERKVDKLKIF